MRRYLSFMSLSHQAKYDYRQPFDSRFMRLRWPLRPRVAISGWAVSAATAPTRWLLPFGLTEAPTSAMTAPMRDGVPFFRSTPGSPMRIQWVDPTSSELSEVTLRLTWRRAIVSLGQFRLSRAGQAIYGDAHPG
jgi:hypothetical protein